MCERERGVKDFSKFGLSNWINDIAIYREASHAQIIIYLLSCLFIIFGIFPYVSYVLRKPNTFFKVGQQGLETHK